jgi:pimeloyl-ACP methyl ester carboxylesterase
MRRTTAWVLALLLLAAGCSFHRTAREAREARTLALIGGTVEAHGGAEGVKVLLYTIAADGRTETAGTAELSALSPDWGFVVVEGEPFVIGAFRDGDGDGVRGRDEPAAYLGLDRPLTMTAGTRMQGVALVLDPACPADARFPLDATKGSGPRQVALRFSTGEVVALDDPRFAPEQVESGLWAPLTALRQNGAGIFFLEPYHPGRIPVLFVHGIGGSPRDLAVLIGKLDRTRFQPWVFYYPSGFRLTTVAAGLSRNLPALRDRLGFRTLFIVAHSMGGLVSRSAILTLAGDPAARDLVGLFVTLASPLGGHYAAKWGLKYTPEPVPAWIDLAPGSPFIEAIARPLPRTFPYYLLFGYHRSDRIYMPWSSDSVVPVAAQIPLWAQRDAVRIWGFDTDHMEIVTLEEPVGVVMDILGRTHRAFSQEPPAGDAVPAE